MLLEPERAGVEDAARQLLSSYRRRGDDALRGLAFEELPALAVPPRMAAVDGGCCTLLDVVSCGCIAVRATYSVREPRDAHRDGPLVERVQVVSREEPRSWWQALLAEFGWGQTVDLPATSARETLPMWRDLARSLLEYHCARTAIRELESGEILLLDGSLEDGFELGELTLSLLERSGERGVALVAVSKDSSRSIHGILPFPVELEEAAARRATVPARFAVDVTEALGLGDRPFRSFGVRWDVRAPVFRVDVPRHGAHSPLQLLAAVGAACNDPVAPGYPYPLVRVHQRAAYPGWSVVDLRRAMEARVSERAGTRLGMRLFGKGRDLLELAT